MGGISVKGRAVDNLIAAESPWLQPARLWPILWIVVSAMLILNNWNVIVTRAGWDPDDQLRLVQLRDFLAGQSWFDTTQYRMNPPDGAPMHWSRLIELPLALVVLIVKPFFGQAIAEMVAGTLIPLIALGFTAAIAGRIAIRLGHAQAGSIAFLMTMLSTTLLAQFRPMRIDHHGWQIMLAVLALWTMFWPHKKKAGIVLGLVLATWQHISLEGLPAATAFFVLLGWRWIVEKAHGERLLWTVTSFSGTTFFLFLATQPHWLSAVSYCDTISPPYLAAIGMAAIIILPTVLIEPEKRLWRVVATAIAGCAAIATILLIAPQCAGGAFGNLDPLVRQYWYGHINEGLPLWHQDFQAIVFVMAMPLCGIFAFRFLDGNVVLVQRDDRRMALYFMIYALVVSLLVFRTVTVATVFAIPLVAVWVRELFDRYRASAVTLKRVSFVGLMIFLFIPGVLASQVAVAMQNLLSKPVIAKPASKTAGNDKCATVASLATLSALPSSRLLAPFDIGPAILLTTSHTILASSHHRNEKAMHDEIEIFRSKPNRARSFIQQHEIDYVVVCADLPELANYRKMNPDGLWAALSKNKAPDWLEQRPDMGEGIKIWRVIR
jgi:hypothetical protein